jgi:hypothetical protein
MQVIKRRRKAVLAVLALAAGAVFVLPASPAGAVSQNNACINNLVSTQASLIPVDMTATASPSPVAPNGSVTLSNINQTLDVPASVFLTGYRAFVLNVGVNTVPAELQTRIEGTNTVEGIQNTNVATGSITTTITDPTPLNRSSGDEAATPGAISVTYANQTWTAGPSGTIEFREDTVQPLVLPADGGLTIHATIGQIQAFFACSPGEVVPSAPPETIVFTNPGATFASTQIQAAPVNQAPTADAGPDQTVGSGASVNLTGALSSDPDGDTLTFAWTQPGGPPVTLTGGNTATPSFTAPAGPATLTFQLEVCDQEPLCDTDTVVINVSETPPVNQAPTADAGPDQTVGSGASVNLTGALSSDPDGDTLTFAWTQPGGPPVTLTGGNTATPSFTAPAGPATLTFQLEVCDQEPLCDTDTVVVTVGAVEPPEGKPCPPRAGKKKKPHKHPPPNNKGKKCGFNFIPDSLLAL